LSEGVVDPIAVTAGIVQTGLYLDFFYVYFTRCGICVSFTPRSSHTRIPRVLQGQKFELPA
jgi:ER lumen protein retaining receptor